MKLFILNALLLMTTNAMAYGSLVIPTKSGDSIEIPWLGTKADDSEVENAWNQGGQDAVFNGDICFKGARKDAIQVLEYFDLNDFMGDEYSIRDSIM